MFFFCAVKETEFWEVSSNDWFCIANGREWGYKLRLIKFLSLSLLIGFEPEVSNRIIF